jgi:RecA/RadA recombinase
MMPFDPGGPATSPARASMPDLLSTGIDGLEDVLGGGLAPKRLHLIEGAPGAGKTTLALPFLLAGRDNGGAHEDASRELRVDRRGVGVPTGTPTPSGTHRLPLLEARGAPHV